MSEFYLVDVNHSKKAIKMHRLYMTASKIAVKYGTPKDYTEEQVHEFWDYDEHVPSPWTFKTKITLKGLKWYINKNIQLSYDKWNSDFLHGLCKSGRIVWKKCLHPSFIYTKNNSLNILFENCPFGFTKNKKDYEYYHCIKGIPALWMKSSDDSLSFMAGVFASGVLEKHGKYTYIRYHGKAASYIKSWQIPIEKCHRISTENKILISPIWPAIFSCIMPIEIAETFCNIKKAFGVEYYAPILWKTYISNDFVVDGIPYLKSRRTIYYHYKCEKGAMKTLEKMRVEKNLTELDLRIGQIVKVWNNTTEVE